MVLKSISGEIASQPLNDNFSYIDSKASNPVSQISSSGTKITENELSPELLAQITGTTPITFSRGYLEVNRGAEFPLRNLVKSGVIEPFDQKIKDLILDVKVINADPTKYYAIDWIGNGYTPSGGTAKYGFIISEYDRSTFATAAVAKEILHYNTMNFPAPTTDLVTRVVSIPDSPLIFIISYDRRAIGTHIQVSQSTYGLAKSSVIDEANYIYTQGATMEKGHISLNAGKIYPFKLVARDGTVSARVPHLENAILDIKVINAIKGKWYRIHYLANGTTAWGDPVYSIYLEEYDYGTFNNKREIFNRVNAPLPAPTENIMTRTIHLPDEKVGLSITLDYSKLGNVSYSMSSSTSAGYSYVIDPSTYIYSEGINDKGVISLNEGRLYPFKNVVREGKTHGRIPEIENAILDIKVINAKKGKWYKVDWFGNGTTAWGDPVYSVYLEEYDEGTWMNRRSIFNRVNAPLPAPTENIVTRSISVSGESVMLVITIDYSKLKATSYVMNISTMSGYGYIIDPSTYIYQNSAVANANEINLPLICTRQGLNFRVKFYYDDTRNMVVDFDRLGINAITHIKRFYIESKANNVGLDPNFDNQGLFETITTDWISPYGIQARTNIVNTSTFTVGGNHGTDGNGGFATARHIETRMYADDKEVLDGQVMFAKEKVVIEAKHAVSAANVIDRTTGEKRDSVYEYVTYVITPNTINVSVSVEAIEDVTYTRYFGPQATKQSWGNTLYFMQDTIPTIHQVSTDITGENSGLWPSSKPDRFVLQGAEGHVLVGQVNRNIGIGDGRYIADGEPSITLSAGDFGKVYAHLIRNNAIDVDAGEVLYYEACYHLSPGLECPGAQCAYHYMNEGKRIYVVDFFNPADTYLKVRKEDSNRRINVLEKSDSITVDNFTTSIGLNIISTGYGSVKFEVI